MAFVGRGELQKATIENQCRTVTNCLDLTPAQNPNPPAKWRVRLDPHNLCGNLLVGYTAVVTVSGVTQFFTGLIGPEDQGRPIDLALIQFP